MFGNKIGFILVCGFVGLCSYQCLKMIPERAQLIYYDEQYFKNVTLNVRRSKRGGEYVINFNFTTLQSIGNNVGISVYFYEYLHNEYKPSFVQLHYKLCDLILLDNFIGGFVRRGGIVKCPVTPGIYSMKNLYFNEKIPTVWPFEKGMFQVVVSHDAKLNGIVGKGEVMMSFKDNVPSKRKETPLSEPKLK